MPSKKWTDSLIEEELSKFNYKLINSFWVEKPYQKQLWVKIKCPKNHIYDVWWNNFLNPSNKCRCKECSYKDLGKIDWTQDSATEFYKQNGLILIDKFKNVDTGCYCIDSLGYYKNLSITNLRQGRNDIKTKFRTLNKYIWENVKRFCKLNHIDYIPIKQKYKGIKSEYYFKYLGNNLPKDTSRYFKTTLDCFVNGLAKHPYLTSSKGELRIRKFLEDNKIKYKSQYTIKECRDINMLKFDFAILDNEELKLIEYDSKIHEVAVKAWDGEEGLINRKRRDAIKDKFCADNNIFLLRIKQKDFNNIESILEKELIKKKPKI